MAEEHDLAPVGADKETGEVKADLSAREDEPIARPVRWVASVMWLWLVLVAGVIALGSAAALVLDFLSGGTPSNGSKETILLIFTTTFQGLVALYVTRPGSH